MLCIAIVREVMRTNTQTRGHSALCIVCFATLICFDNHTDKDTYLPGSKLIRTHNELAPPCLRISIGNTEFVGRRSIELSSRPVLPIPDAETETFQLDPKVHQPTWFGATSRNLEQPLAIWNLVFRRNGKASLLTPPAHVGCRK